MSETQPKYFSIKELFSHDEYIIPIYQRDYAWESKQIIQLLHDIADSYADCKNKNINKKYYIGTLIAYEDKKDGKIEYQVIDGQQRLTTLTLLLDYLKNEQHSIDMDWYSKKQRLYFDCRQKSTQTLDLLYEGTTEYFNDIDVNVTIKNGYEDIKKWFSKICKENNIKEEDFCSYLFTNVTILRVLVPYDTDLNHYFEIMNSRGEQLEKHEVLKAKCLEKLKSPEDQAIFALIWDSCSNMERYIQYGFSTEQRDLLFNNPGEDTWNYIPKTPEEVFEKLKNHNLAGATTKSNTSLLQSLEEIIDNPPPINDDSKENQKKSLRFNTIINFSNFLLHILKIQLRTDVPLDDKRLLDSFDDQIKKLDNKDCENFIKTFGFNLLKGKMLYDRYVIKREYIGNVNNWSLQKLHIDDKKSQYYKATFSDENENREIIMLLSMFHVSNPTLVYKNWLNGVLLWLFDNPKPDFKEYKNYLENLAKAFFYDRYVKIDEKQLDFYTIIYKNKGVPQTVSKEEVDFNVLNKGVDVDNFIFNYLDYLLWQDYMSGKKKYFPENFKPDSRVANFEYTFRSSVEHYYPQHPIDNMSIDKDNLDNFGNLCLISSSKNSRLSNYMPIAKKEHYLNSPTIDSIKQCIMMSYDEWDTAGKNGINEIQEHSEMMKHCLFDYLK